MVSVGPSPVSVGAVPESADTSQRQRKTETPHTRARARPTDAGRTHRVWHHMSSEVLVSKRMRRCLMVPQQDLRRWEGCEPGSDYPDAGRRQLFCPCARLEYFGFEKRQHGFERCNAASPGLDEGSPGCLRGHWGNATAVAKDLGVSHCGYGGKRPEMDSTLESLMRTAQSYGPLRAAPVPAQNGWVGVLRVMPTWVGPRVITSRRSSSGRCCG